jgi:hypothetical protein
MRQAWPALGCCAKENNINIKDILKEPIIATIIKIKINY